MWLLLERLEAETNRMYSDDDADLDLVHDIMVYMTGYPDAVHHPKEDRLYAELKAVRPDLSEGMSKITAEHRDIAERGQKLRTTIEQILVGQPTRRTAMVEDSLRYVQALRRHMQWEERDLFRRLDVMIRDGHNILDKAVFVEVADPVFGPQVEEVFARLLASINKAD